MLATVDVDANKKLARAYDIAGIPAVKAFRNGGSSPSSSARSRASAVDAFLDELTKPPVADELDDEEVAAGARGRGLRARVRDPARPRGRARCAERGEEARRRRWSRSSASSARLDASARLQYRKRARAPLLYADRSRPRAAFAERALRRCRVGRRMRLNAWLARAGVASRRGADELIKAGRVTVNGEPGQLNTFVAARDRVELDGRPLAKQRLAYVLLHKPAGVVTTARDPQGRPTVVELVDHRARVVPVGRLDADTTGALLLTNDGDLAHRLAHPRYEVDKVYVADVEGDPSDAALRGPRARRRARRRPHRAGPRPPARPRPRRARRSTRAATHQVKRMLAAVGHPVRRLHRRATPASTSRASSRATGASSTGPRPRGCALGLRRAVGRPSGRPRSPASRADSPPR